MSPWRAAVANSVHLDLLFNGERRGLQALREYLVSEQCKLSKRKRIVHGGLITNARRQLL